MQHGPTELSWDDLQTLLAVREAGSFSRAARRLGVEPSTVGRRMAVLQESLGATLLERSLTGTTLTGAGEEVVAAARDMEQAVSRMQLRVSAVGARISGRVRATMPETVAALLVVPLAGALRRLHPDLELEIAASASVLNLVRREADLALRLFRPTQAGLVTRRIERVPFALYAPARGERRLPLLRYDPSLQATPHGGWLESQPADGPCPLRSASFFALASAARAGLGLALLPRFMGEADPGLVRVSEPKAIPAPDLWLALPAELRRSPRVRAVADFLAERLALLLRQGARAR